MSERDDKPQSVADITELYRFIEAGLSPLAASRRRALEELKDAAIRSLPSAVERSVGSAAGTTMPRPDPLASAFPPDEGTVATVRTTVGVSTSIERWNHLIDQEQRFLAFLGTFEGDQHRDGETPQADILAAEMKLRHGNPGKGGERWLPYTTDLALNLARRLEKELRTRPAAGSTHSATPLNADALDAARYRWLCSDASNGRGDVWDVVDCMGVTKDQCDAAIDAAMNRAESRRASE
jgi:hypothetical protein